MGVRVGTSHAVRYYGSCPLLGVSVTRGSTVYMYRFYSAPFHLRQVRYVLA